jgi:2-polyprenyl-6-methoxyphenol hydroxylase-like FAD-dependent oxidoreductase
VREQFVPQAQPVYAGYIAWRAVLDERELPRSIGPEIFELYTFCLPQREQLLGYPVPGRDNDTAIGRRAYNIVWYRPTDPAALADMSTDARGHYHASGIPPPLIRKDVIARVKSDAKALLAAQIAQIFLGTEPFFQPIFDLQSPALAFGRVALLGDAAFVARPHVGAGATKAAIDAAVLAKCLQSAGGAVESGLARYQELQLPFGREIVALSREQGAYLSGGTAHGAPRESGEARDIASLLAAHGTRSDQITAIVAARGLDAYF